jgi:hypothetical protein
MSAEFEALAKQIDGLVKQAFENGVKTERLRVLNIITKEAKATKTGKSNSDWIVALIEGRDK